MTDQAPAPEDVTYRTIDGEPLLARLYRPAGDGPANWIVDAHGGAWGSGDRMNNEVIHLDLAAHGVGVFALDFRPSSVAQYPGPVEDVSVGVRWFRTNAARLGIDPKSVGGLGSSSGGQQMGCIALLPGGAPWAGGPDDDLSGVDASVDFFIACWPILDPLARYHMAKEKGVDRLVEAHHAYFADEAAMEEGNPYLILERGAATHRPPMLILQGTSDANVEHTRADTFAELYRSRGGAVDVIKYDGMPHTFVTADPDSDASKKAIADIREFALAQ